MKRWQDVVEEIYGGGKPETIPVIAEKIKRMEPIEEIYTPLSGYQGPEQEKRKRDDIPGDISQWIFDHFNFGVGIAFIFALIVGAMVASALISHYDVSAKPCKDMLEWAVKDLPARCLAELSKVTPR